MQGPAATLTLGELYERQGLSGKARSIYEELSRSGAVAVQEEATRRLQRMGGGAGAAIAMLRELSQRVRDRRRAVEEGN